MRLSYLALLFAMFQSSVKGNESSCLTEVVEGTDYFPHKVVPENSQHWSVTYENTYKIVTNDSAGKSYLLYQCGTEPPTDQVYDGVFAVPLSQVGLLYTTMIPFLEILGARDKIGAFLGSIDYVSSPCLSQLFDEDKVAEVLDPFNATSIDASILELPSFVGNDGGTALINEISDSVSEEDENLAAFEWIKFYSLFFNLEEVANEIFSATKSRYTCAENNAALLACGDETRSKVLWASYSSYCGGWDVATCPNYYCEFAENCQADLLNSDTQGSFYSEMCGRNYMTTDEFVEFGRDADIWIFPSPDFDTTYATYKTVLSDFKSIKNQQVFDTEGNGAGMWFEQRLAEPDVVLQDFCNIAGREDLSGPTTHQRSWFRNVFTEPVGNAGQCTDTTAPLVPKATECVPLASTSCQGSGTTENSDTTEGNKDSSSASKAGLMATFVALSVVTGF